MIAASSTTVVSFPELGWGPWTIQRYLFEDLFGKISVAWYGVIICCAIILACFLTLRCATKREGFALDPFLDYFIFAIPVGILGARCMYVLARLDTYDSFYEMIAVWHGGLAIYGAVIAGALTVFIVSRVKKQSILKVYDAMVPGLLIAQAIGRWGNFVNGEAYGQTITGHLPWGMMVGDVGPVHPTFLYESLITFTGFCLAYFVLYPRKKQNGTLTAFYLVWYGVGRFLVEGLRTDSLMVGPLRLAQCIGVLSALAGLALFILLAVKKKKAALPAGEENKDAAPEGETGAEPEEAKPSQEEDKETKPEEEKSPAPEEKDEEKENGAPDEDAPAEEEKGETREGSGEGEEKHGDID